MSSYNLLSSVRFSPSILKPFTIDDETQPTADFSPLGGFLCDTKYAWLAKGAVLQVICTKTQTKISEWIFGNILRDRTIRITCVDEIPRKRGSLPLLAIGLQSSVIGGYICVFDIALSKVVRTIDVKYNVSSVLFVETENGSVPLPGSLRAFDGVLAIGLGGGDVLLVDLCWQILDEVLCGNVDVKDELNPCEIVLLLNKDLSKIEYYKEKSIRKGFHLAIHLNYVDKDPSPHFKLKAPNGETIVLVNSAEVAISALHYCPQLGSLLVGFNFGALQLWNIITMELVYTSPVYEKNMPVSHFAVQEPSDDPKAFCYIWAVYSNTEPFIADFPIAALYSFTYTTKEYHEGYGYLYEGFVSCRVRFQMDLMLPDDYVPHKKPKGAWCVGLKALNKNRNTVLMELPEDNLVITCFVWTVWCSASETVTYQAIFDLNQWYKEQMPAEPQWDDCSSYLMYKRITGLYQHAGKENGIVLDTTIKHSSITQFMGVQRLEEHYYPSSLSFDFSVLRDKDVSLIAVRGVQKAFLHHLQVTGPLAVLQPVKLYQEITRLGLTPLFTDVLSEHSINESDQRKLILNVALEQQMLSWLCNCAREWANGSFSSAGCTLELLLNWAWDRAVILKNNADNLCISLFDYSGIKLDTNSQKIVNCCCRQLSNLNTFYGFIINKLWTFLFDRILVQIQCDKLRMVSTYFEVLQWLINVRLLPETPSEADGAFNNQNGFVPYPVEIISNYYNKRRTELSQLSEKRFREKQNLLFIDSLIDLHCGGMRLQKQWQDEEGDGLYPPPSLQALLRTYLLENVDVSHKHSLVVYVFLDLAMVLNQDRYTETITQLIKFPAVFKLSQSLIKITQAFWQLDHEDFGTALEHLLDPLVLDSDLKLWHHRIVLKALLAQEQYNFGLLYLKTRNPPMVNEDDVKLTISFYVANSMVDNAFYLLRRNGNNKPKDKLLLYFFGECVRFEKTREVLAYPLSIEEETAFFTYLETINHPYAHDIRVFYNIMKSRFLDAYELNTRAHLNKFATKNPLEQENAALRDFMISAYKKLMPEISQKLLSACQKERTAGLWMEVPKPVPMSVFIHDTKEQVKYKSTLINASLAKAKDTWTHPVLQRKYDDIMRSEDIPFLRTPKVDLKEKRKMTPTVIEPVIIDANESENDGPSPPKRAKLVTKLDTPIVRRKTPRMSSRLSVDAKNVSTPHSILKVGYLTRKLDDIAASRGESTTPEDLNETTDISPKPQKESGLVESATHKRFSFGLTPRRSLSRLDNHAVRFAGSTTLSSSTTVSTQRTTDSLREDTYKTVSPEETFHSIDSNIVSESPDSDIVAIEKQLKEIIAEDEAEQKQSQNVVTTESKEIKLSGTPKPRRSLRSTVSPVRQSPRLSKQKTSSNTSSASPSSPRETSTPISTPTKRFSPSRRMSLKQKVLTNNALKALTPRSRIVETSYSKVDTVTTKVKTADGTEDSIVTSVVERTDVVKEEETVKTHEHRESTKVSTQKSFSDYSEGDIGLDKYASSSYKGPELSDSIFQSDAEENSGQIDVVDAEAKTETENEVEKIMGSSRNETGIDPTLNVYEDKDEPEIDTKEETVLTEMPLMSQEQYIAMEENDFDELHEEYFNEEVILQQYLSPSKKASAPEDKQKSETVVSELIEIDSSSSNSEKGNSFNSDDSSVASNSTDELEKVQSESESESESSEDKDKGFFSRPKHLEGTVVEEVIQVDDASIDSNEERSSVTSAGSHHKLDDVGFVDEQNSVASEGSPRGMVVSDEEEQKNVIPDVVLVDSKEEQSIEVAEENRQLETIFEEDTQEQQITTADSKEQEAVGTQIGQLEEYAHLPEAPIADQPVIEHQEVVESKPNTPNESKSDLEYSVLSQNNVSRSLCLTLHKTDLSYSLETPNESHISKSDLEFTVMSGERSVHVFPTTSTPFLDGNISHENNETAASTPKTRTRRSKSVDLPEPMQTRRGTLRKRSISVDFTDDNVEKPKSRKRSLTTKLPAILEEDKKAETQQKPSTSGVLETKRVTRKQRNIVAPQNEDSSESENEERGPSLAPMDPLKLLDKPSFRGKSDPEEACVRGKSPSTISRTSSTSELQQAASETSVSRKRSFTKAKTISPPPLTIRTRSRTKSVDLPAQREPRRRTKSGQSVKDDNSFVAEVASTSRKTRAKSVSSIKSDTAGVGKKKAISSKKSQRSLTKIDEDKVEQPKPGRRITRSTSSKM